MSVQPQSTTRELHYQLLASGPLPDRTYTVANFIVDGPSNIDLSNWQSPIHIARAGNDTKTRRLPQPDPSHPPEKRQEARKTIQKSRRGYPFHLEDASKKNCFNGHLELEQSNKFEPEQSNKYVIFKSENGVFKVIPCDDWYSFKREPKNTPLPLEEAERILKEQKKGERGEKGEKAEKAAEKPTTVEPKMNNKFRDKIVSIKKENKEKETRPLKEEFNATGEEVEHEDEEISGFPKRQKRKEKKGEDMDFDKDFDDDNKEDKLGVTAFEKPSLSTDAKEVRKLINKDDDDFSDDDEKEFDGVDELFSTDKKQPKEANKRAADAQGTPGNAKKPRTDGAANGNGNAAVSERDVEKQVRDFLTINGKVELPKLLTRFSRIINVIGKVAFKNLMKRLAEAKKEDGRTFIYLKDDQYRDFR